MSGPGAEATPAQPEYPLSFWLAAIMVLQAAGGFFIEGLYRDNAWVVSVLRGTDLETLFLDVPLLIGATLLARRGSPRALPMLAHVPRLHSVCVANPDRRRATYPTSQNPQPRTGP